MSLHKLFFILLLSIGIFSCSNELNIAADWKSIPVIYAIVDAGEDVNYFRVEKAFLDPDISGEAIARIPDSLYYGEEILVRVTNTRNDKSVILERVNLEDEGFTREEGVFATSPNIGYKLILDDLEMELNETLKLELLGSDESVLTEAQADVLGEYSLTTGQPANPIRFIEGRDISFGIRSDEQAGRFYDCRVYINYEEQDINDPSTIVSKRLEWILEKGRERKRTSANGDFQSLTVFKIKGEEFFKFIGDAIEENGSISRTFKGIDLQYDAGGEDLLNYINIGQANTGVTSNQLITSFTNFNNDAIGVFSSRKTTVNLEDSFNINTESRDSLRDGRFTRSLNFN